MSEYAEIKIKNLSLCSFRNYLDSSIVGLFFSKGDLVIEPNCKEDPEDEDSIVYTKYLYKTTVKRAIDRLDAQGFTLKSFEKQFGERANEIIDYKPRLKNLHIDPENYEKKAKERIEKYVTFQKWKNSIEKVINYEILNGNILPYGTAEEICITTECDKILFQALKDCNQESFYANNIDIINIAFVFRLILDNCDPNDDVVLDFSFLAYWDDDCIPLALLATEGVEKTIVLVEGTSDKDILEFSMRYLYPHLVDLFYFMDFDDEFGAKRDGGTSFVVKNLKTFYFSRIKSRFIAIFDNDAEGYYCKCSLLNDVTNWPDNFRILMYPETKLSKAYPTLASNGAIITDNINRKACSIELYLPDSLIMDNNQYYPIEWESRKMIKFNGTEENLYQGVISHKDRIKQSFHALKREIENGKQCFDPKAWERMKVLLDCIVFAYK